MQGKKFDSIAAALLLLLNGAPAKDQASLRDAEDRDPVRSPVLHRAAEVGEAAGGIKAVEHADRSLPPERRTAAPEYGIGVPGQTFLTQPAPAAVETSGTEDPMEIIDGFFRRDSRRYDGGFGAGQVL